MVHSQSEKRRAFLSRLGVFFRWIVQTHVGMALASLLLALLFLVVLILIFGSDPIEVISSLFNGAVRGPAAVKSTLEEMTVLLLSGLAILIPITGGFFNIAAQGQLEIAGFVSAVVALYCPGPDIVVLFIALFAGMLAGILVSFIPLLLRVKRGASEVTTGIMLNFVCTLFVNAMIYGPFMEQGAFYATTEKVVRSRMIPQFGGFHIGVYFTLALCVVMFVFLSRSTFGLKLRATGFNSKAASALGVSVKSIMNRGVFLGAAMAGLAGAVEVLGVTSRVTHGWASNWGFTGVCIAFLGGNAIGMIPIALLLSILGVGGRHMQAMTGVPVSLVDILKGLPVVIFLIFVAIRRTGVIYRLSDVRLFKSKRVKDC